MNDQSAQQRFEDFNTKFDEAFLEVTLNNGRMLLDGVSPITIAMANAISAADLIAMAAQKAGIDGLNESIEGITSEMVTRAKASFKELKESTPEERDAQVKAFTEKMKGGNTHA